MTETTQTKPKKSRLILAIILLSLLSFGLAISLWYVYHPPQKVFFGKKTFLLLGDSLKPVEDKTIIGEGPHLSSDDFVSDDDARENVRQYRYGGGGLQNPALGKAGVYFDPSRLDTYIHTTFDSIIKTMPAARSNEKWVIAFYWMMKNDPRDMVQKNAFFMLPSKVVDSSDGNSYLYDYFIKRDEYYPRHNKNTAEILTGKDTSHTALDNGQLYP